MTAPTGFSVNYRNPGHWDIYVDRNRAFRIRGGPGDYSVMDERAAPYPSTKFNTVAACMVFICDQLMHELIVAEGQAPTVIESWNVKST